MILRRMFHSAFGFGSVYYILFMNWPKNGYINYVQNNSDFGYEIMVNSVYNHIQKSINGADSAQWISHKNIYDSAGNWDWYYNLGSDRSTIGSGTTTDTTFLGDNKYVMFQRGG